MPDPFFKTFEIEGRHVLVYVEPCGDESFLHQIAEIDGLGQIDMKIGNRAEYIDAIFASYNADNAAGVLKQADEIAAFGGGN